MSDQPTNSAPIVDSANPAQSDSQPADQIQQSKPEATEQKPLTATEKKLIKELKLKIDGKEVTESLPFEVSEEHADYLTKQLQLAKMSHKRASETSDLKKTFRAFIEDLRSNPKAILSDPAIGLDVKKFAQDLLNEEAEQAKKSPEQIELEKLQAELKLAKEEKEKLAKETMEKERTFMEQQEAERYDKSFTEALSSANLPKSPYVIKKMADYMLEAIKLGKKVEPSDIVPLVQEEIQQDLADMFRSAPDEAVERFIGKERLNGFRKKAVSKAKEAPPVPVNKAIVDVGGKKPEKEQVKKDTFRTKYGKY